MEMDKKGLKGFKIFILILLVFSLLFLNKNTRNKIMALFNSFMNSEKTLKLKYTIKDISDVESVSFYDGNVIKWNTNRVSFLNPDGSIILEKEFNFFNPSIYYGDKYIYVFDRETGDIYAFDSKGNTVKRYQLNKEIYNIKESSENLIVHIKSSDGEVVEVLDKDKVLIGNYIYEGKNILTYNANDEGTRNLVAILDLNEEALKSQVDIYGINNERINTLDFKEEIVIYLDFTHNGDIIVLTDKNLYFISNGKVMWKKQFDLIKDIYLEKDKINVLYSTYLEIIDFSGRTEKKLNLIEEYNKMVPFGDYLLLYGNSNMLFIKEGKEVLKSTENINKVFASKNEVLVLSDEDIKIYEFTNRWLIFILSIGKI